MSQQELWCERGSPPEQQRLLVKAAVNTWMSETLTGERTQLSLGQPKQGPTAWCVPLLVKRGTGAHSVGEVYLDKHLCIIKAPARADLDQAIQRIPESHALPAELQTQHTPDDAGFFYGDGIAGSARLADKSIDLLLTDPPYSISNAYTCEQQIPRRLRPNGGDFIMPKGDFGAWDQDFSPRTWAEVIIPKVRGWAVIFCSQAQIGDYEHILKDQGFNAVGTIVWHKTNPVPFNTRFKPVNAWEAGVIGKRPGTQFYGHGVVHNVFTYKSPSPQHRIHPTQKPLGLFRELMSLFSQKGELVLDPFAGAGTTVCAANELERRVIAFENDKDHYRRASQRISACAEVPQFVIEG